MFYYVDLFHCEIISIAMNEVFNMFLYRCVVDQQKLS